MDKETLVKHHFWILLGLVLILLPVVAGGVWMGVADATAAEQSKVDGQKAKLDAAKPQGNNILDALKKGKETLDAQKDVVWKDAYQAQAGLISWPQSFPDYNELNKLHFGEPVRREVLNAFLNANVYLPEFESLAALVKPTELTGGWQQVMKFVKRSDRNPSVEDVWLALEDLCIQREMLRCVHAVNMLLATFERVDTPEVQKELQEKFKPVAGEFVGRFVSPYWELDLAMVKADRAGRAGQFDVRTTLKNVSGRRLNVAAIDFELAMTPPSQPSNPAVLRIEGGYLGHDETLPESPREGPRSFTKRTINSSAPKAAVYGVTQRLDARFVPVKRIDKIELGYHSHRTADRPKLMATVSAEEKKKQEAKGGGEATDPAAGGPPGAGGPPSTDMSQSGIPRLRYVTVTDQVRRMPIGLVLVVDQAHVQDVLRAFANSRLRFQTTQMHFTRLRNPAAVAAAGAPAAVPAVPAAPFGRPLPGLQGMAPAATPTSAVEENPNLVEMAIYGLASIYEKYPPRAPVPTEATAPADSSGAPSSAPPAAAPAPPTDAAAPSPAPAPAPPAADAPPAPKAG